MRESFFYTNNPKAKLFQRFTFEKELQLDNGNDYHELILQLNDYKNYKQIKWAVETDIQNGTSQPIQALTIDTIHLTIITNSIDKIQQGDIIYLEYPLWKSGKFFIIDDDVRIDIAKLPKPTIFRQHLSLKSLL